LLHSNAQLLENKLKDYRVEGQVVEIRPGPVVTLYEFVPAPGIKISQVSNLADDLAMALKAISIRIVAPIPGKGTIGIEVPNEVRETVFLKEILTHDRFVRSTSKLSLALGKDITGNPVVADLAKMPHLLIAGATGSGKSVALNGFLLSLLYKATPSEVRIILADPKVVELSVYEGIPHLLLPVVSDPKQIASAMKWAVNEMERRYELLGSAEVRNIVSYNEKIDEMQKSDLLKKEKSVFQDTAVTDRAESATVHDEISQKLPFIVIIIDEFADIMAVASKDVEGSVMRLAQKARAAGIHLIMATQRPSKEVITGLIKSNLNARISFKVASKIDSRIVLDTNGADNLLSAGDMLFLTPDSSLRRIHGPFVGEDEVKRVVEYWKSQGKPEYDYEIIQSDRENVEISEEEKDEFYDMAKKIVMETRKASISFIQRRLGVGYNRAAKMIEMMEFEGLISPQNSRGEREVLIT
jgi:S-DNA-T family DNA segregation ATPase FtsK/SpoIIIE